MVFRKNEEDGEIIAVFPEIPSTPNPATCLIYAHVGQHANADCRSILRNTAPATPKEYGPLMRELETIGYWLDVRKRVTAAMHQARFAELESS